MTDEEYLFRQTEIERKRNARGDFNKKRQGGRRVRLPSDHMSKKEWQKMNGEVKTYNMNAPVGWKEFFTWPADIQRDYITRLEFVYHAKTHDIADMLGISECRLQEYRRELGIQNKRGGKRPKLDEENWKKFLGEELPFEAIPPEPPEDPTCRVPGSMDFAPGNDPNASNASPNASNASSNEPDELDEGVLRLAMLLQALKGTGAKLTIEVTL